MFNLYINEYNIYNIQFDLENKLKGFFLFNDLGRFQCKFLKDSRNKTVLTIIIAAFLLAAAFAGGKWGVRLCR